MHEHPVPLRASLLASLALAACAAPSAPETPEPAPTPASKLALATFDDVWTTVRDQHFDPDLNGVDWEAVRAELRPRAAAAETDEEVQDVVGEMLDRLGQSHFVILPRSVLPPLDGSADDAPSEELAGEAGFDVRVRGGDVLVSSVRPGGPAHEAGVRPGWVLLERDGAPLGERARAVEGSEGKAWRHAAMALAMDVRQGLLGPIGSHTRLRFRDDRDAEVEIELERAERDTIAHDVGTNLPTFFLEFEDEVLELDGVLVGRIRFTNWFLPVQQSIDAAVDAMRGCDGIVIDLRGNTGGVGLMVVGLAGHFVAEPTELGRQTMRDGVVRYTAQPRKVDGAGQRVEPFAGPLAILTDETTGSASEVFAGGMQSIGRARVFGETSAGAVLPATTRTLPNGDGLLFAFGDFKTSTGVLLEGRGVLPDVEVPLTRAGLLADGDPQLEAAIAWIAAGGR